MLLLREMQMAFKKYAYYLRGNQIAIVESDTRSSSGFKAVAHCTVGGHSTKDACEAAGGQWIPSSGSNSLNSDEEFQSPTETISNGLEIEYSYSPIYNIQSTGTEGTDFHRFIGWGSDGTNLLLFTYGASAVADLSSLFSADDWILIKGSGRWSGLHQVKSTGGATGILTLKTKCNLKPSTFTASVNFVAQTSSASGYLTGNAANHTMDIEAWKDQIPSRDSYYIFIGPSEDATNNGIFKVTYPSTSGKINFVNRITIDADGDYTSTEEAIAAETNDGVAIYNIFYEQISVYEGLEVMEDESFELDVDAYISKAIVYYLKAKMAEEKFEIELKEYFMREFYRLLDKYDSRRLDTMRFIQAPLNGVR